MLGAAQREDALLSPAFLFVSARSAESRVEAVVVERLLQRLSFHHRRVQCRARGYRVDAPCLPLLVGVDEEIETKAPHSLVAERDHLPELPSRIDVKQREWRFTGKKRLARQMQHDA